MKASEEKCPFCLGNEKIFESEYVYARFDKYPVSKGHAMVITKRHIPNYFEASKLEKADIWQSVDHLKEILEEEFKPDAFNIGVNVGEAAGQTVPHLHVHIIPRYEGDVANPRGGVRGVIPSKQKY